jgi:galactose-1-phosphate uridylyltransferase
MPKASMNPVHVQVWISEEASRRLQEQATSKCQSRSEYVRAALLVALAKDEKEGKESK